jgi:hypothetical protein
MLVTAIAIISALTISAELYVRPWYDDRYHPYD